MKNKNAKKNRLFMLIVIILSMALTLCACGSSSEEAAEETAEPLTLEKYVADNPDFRDTINQYGENDESVSVYVEGNDLVFDYDVAKMEGATEELLASDELAASLDEGIEEQKDTFLSVRKTIAEATGVEKINVVVKYCNGDTEITSRTFSK